MPVFADLANPESLIYRFGRFEVDEARYTFKIDGTAVPLTGKPWQLLLLLLKHSPDTVSRREILKSVWAGRVVTDGVLTQAVSRLRIALSDPNQMLVHTVHGIGFALKATVTVVQREVTMHPENAVIISRATRLPGHHAWQLLEPMAIGGRAAVWLAEHRVTHERHVFKFAIDAPSLASIKRELAVSRLLDDVQTASGCVPILDWNLLTAPYYIELPFIDGQPLDEWCLEKTPVLTEKLELLAGVADTLAGLHRAGLVHADLKPQNILIQSNPEQSPSVFLTDFGSAAVLNLERLRALSVSLAASDVSPGTGGTLLYMAPEVLAGSPPTAATDVYALGIILYQLLIGRFDQSIGPGWEAAIASDVLRGDIRDFCNVDARLRETDAAQLALRLRSVAVRDEQTRQAHATQAQLAQYQALSARRRGYGWAALLFITISLVASIGWYSSIRNKQAAQLAKSETEMIMHYLLDKVFFRADPMQAGPSSITVVEALSSIEGSVNEDLKEQPAARAAVLEQLVIAYTSLNDIERATTISRNALRDASLALSEKSRDEFTFNLAENLRHAGRNVESLPMFEELLRSSSLSALPLDRAIILLNLSATHIYLGHFVKGRMLAAQAALVSNVPLEMQANIQNGADQAQGMAFGYLGDIDQAAAYFAKIERRAKQNNSLDPSLMAKRGQAWLLVWRGQLPQAVILQRQVLASIQEQMPGSLPGAVAKVTLVEFLLRAQQSAEAKKILIEWLKLQPQQDFNVLLSGRKQVLLAMAHLAEANVTEAQRVLLLAEPLIIAGDSRESDNYARWLEAQAELQRQTGDETESRKTIAQASALRQRLRNF